MQTMEKCPKAGLVVLASSSGESACEAAYLRPISTQIKARLTSRRCTKFLVQATPPSYSCAFQLTRGSMLWSLFAMRLLLGFETRFTAALLTFSPSSSRSDCTHHRSTSIDLLMFAYVTSCLSFLQIEVQE